MSSSPMRWEWFRNMQPCGHYRAGRAGGNRHGGRGFLKPQIKGGKEAGFPRGKKVFPDEEQTLHPYCIYRKFLSCPDEVTNDTLITFCFLHKSVSICTEGFTSKIFRTSDCQHGPGMQGIGEYFTCGHPGCGRHCQRTNGPAAAGG